METHALTNMEIHLLRAALEAYGGSDRYNDLSEDETQAFVSLCERFGA